MEIKRNCKICGSDFSAIKTTQFFCSRKCFKRDYYVRTKVEIINEKQNPNYPIKYCSFCGESSKLDFDPLVDPHLYKAWGCPSCGATNRLILEYQDKPNSKQIIQQFLSSLEIQISQVIEPQYQTYHLPISNPEMGNNQIVVMTCEELNILDIQKGSRKKIVFS